MAQALAPTGGGKKVPPPKPPAPHGFLGGVSHVVTHAVPHAVTHAVHAATTPHAGAHSFLGGVAPTISHAVHSAIHAASHPHYGNGRSYQQNLAAYRQAVAETFLRQSPLQKAAIIRGLGGISTSLEAQGVKSAWAHVGQPEKLAVARILQPKAYSSGDSALGDIVHTLGHVAGEGLAGARDALAGVGAHTQLNQESNISTGGLTPSSVTQVATRAPFDVAIAGVQDPSVIPKTIGGLGNLALGAATGLAELPVRAVQHGVGNAISGLAHSVAHDYSQRYGPLASGNDKAFIARIKKEGAAPELLDALGFTAGIDATAGRAAASLGRAREAMTGDANFLTRARPVLRVSGNEVRAQHLAPGAMKITAQRIEDRLRALKGSKEIQLRHGEIAPVFQGRSMRVLVSGIASKTRQVMQHQLNREVRQGAQGAARKLTGWERRAAPFALEGTIPLRGGADAARAAIEQRMAQIRQDRARSPLSPGNRIPEQIRPQVDELHLLSQLHANVEKWLTPRLSKFVEGEAARSARLEENLPHSFLTGATAEARRLRPQGEVLGIKHPSDLAPEQLATLWRREEKVAAMVRRPGTVGELQAARNAMKRVHAEMRKVASGPTEEQLRAYSKQVRAQARQRGLPEPAYLKHSPHPKTDFSAYTQGQGAKAMAMPKKSEFALFRGGAVHRDLQSYVDSLARTIKGAHQWRLVDEQARRNLLPTPPAAAIRAALGRDVHPADLTGFQLTQTLMHMGVDLKHVRFYNPGRLAQSTLEDFRLLKGSRAGSEPNRLEADANLAHALGQNDVARKVSPGDLAKMDPHDPFLTSPGWKALPKSAWDEIHSSLSPSGAAGRIVGRIQGSAAGLILGLSPSFVIMNTLAHVYLSAFGTRGRLLSDVAKFPLWWHGLTEEERNIVRANAGGHGMYRLEHMGSTGGKLSELARGFSDSNVGRFIHQVNPMRAMFRAEDLQSNFFRHMVYYSAAKRQALDNLAHNLDLGAQASVRLSHAFTVGPKDEMARILQSQADAEALGRYTVNMMGDYARFTSFERKWINNRAVLFYSFLRHATRTLLYVLPVKHPIATAIVGELAKLHNDEVKQLLGGQDMPWAYSRLFFDKNGKLSSVDLLRSSPVGGAVVDAASQGTKGLVRLVAPEVQPVLDMMYGQTPLGQKAPNNVFTALSDYLTLSYPYRLAKDLRFGTTEQQPGSIPFLHERPVTHKSAAGQAYQAAKEQARGPIDQKILGSLFGLYPKPDDSQVIAAHRAALAAKKKGGKSKPSGSSGSWGGGASSSSSGGGWGGGTTTAAGWG